jgi:hypothetical protein
MYDKIHSATQAYGYVFDKQGNKKHVLPPITSDGKKVRKHTKTQTGKIPDNVGFKGYK